MSEPFDSGIGTDINCPKCGAECEGKDLGDHPYFLSCECSECGFEFAHDTYQEEYYDLNGSVIK